MRTMIVVVLCVAAVCLSTASQRQRPVVDPANVAFGYTDDTGSKLLTLADDKSNLPIDVERAKSIVAAVCSEGREFPIRYVQFQKHTAASNFRQSARNFANDEGHLFEFLQGHAQPDDTCLLVPAGYLQANPISANEVPNAELAKESVSRIEKEKARSVKTSRLLHRHGAGQEVATVEFVPMPDSLLGGLVLVEPTRLSFFDMPANLKEREHGSCWRVDDGCVFGHDGMNVPAVFGEAGRQLVFFTTQGFEGQAIVLFQAKDGKLVALRRAYRYQAAV